MSYLWYWPDGGWDFDDWREHQAWTPVRSEQSGAAEPLPLLPADDGDRDRPRLLAYWEQAATRWRAVSVELLGVVSDQPPRVFRWQTLGERLTTPGGPGSYALRRLRYSLTDTESGYAWLLTPEQRGGHGPRPAVIALHQTNPTGKAEVVGLERTGSESDLHYAAELAAAGFVVLAPDALGFGERQAGHAHAHYRSAHQFYSAHPDGSLMAKMAYDVSRAVDLLERLPDVDARRIGCIGHSHGAYGTLFAMLHEPRIRVGVMSCGLNLLRHDPTPHRWWRQTALIPRLGCYEHHLEQVPLDFHHLLALLAPRPVMIVAGTRDRIFPDIDRLPASLDQVGEIYRLYDAGDQLRQWIFDGPHSFPQPARHAAYTFLADRLLGAGPDPDHAPS